VRKDSSEILSHNPIRIAIPSALLHGRGRGNDAIVISMRDLEWCYRILELKPGASLEEVNQAYKDLVFIWHPDRIPQDNPRLLEKAQEKLKDLNSARDRLRANRSAASTKSSQSVRHHYKPYPRPHESYQSTQRAEPGYTSHSTHRASTQTQASRNSQSEVSSQPTSQAQSEPKPQSSSRSQPNSQSQPVPQPQPSYPAGKHPDLSGADLSGANLKEKDLSGRDLSHANLSNANLSDAFLHRVNLNEANLYKANLFRANLLQANLRKANLREANLIGADFSGADLSGADLSGAKVGSADRIMVKLTGANLAGAILPDGTLHQ
jgi:uncharacterized protein YjbI with pentapeptide repeats